MNAREFYEAVKKMRHLQQELFRHRGTDLLIKCRNSEKIVDGEISRVEGILLRQGQKELNLGI